MADEPAPLPAEGPATLAAVKVELGIGAADETDDAKLTPRVAAANALVRGWPCVDVARADPALDDWPAEAAQVVLGANMLVARLYSRRNSPAGWEAVGGDLAVYVSRSDPDLAMLLGLGAWQGPRVG